MSGTQAAAVFMNDAGSTLLLDSASEVTTAARNALLKCVDAPLQAKFPPNLNAPASTDSTLFNAINRVLSEYGFDNESSAFISTCLLQQQSAFTLKMTQQRQAFDACIESFKCSAAAQMELQLVQLSVIHPFHSIPFSSSSCKTHHVATESARKRVYSNCQGSQRQQKNRTRAEEKKCGTARAHFSNGNAGAAAATSC